MSRKIFVAAGLQDRRGQLVLDHVDEIVDIWRATSRRPLTKNVGVAETPSLRPSSSEALTNGSSFSVDEQSGELVLVEAQRLRALLQVIIGSSRRSPAIRRFFFASTHLAYAVIFLGCLRKLKMGNIIELYKTYTFEVTQPVEIDSLVIVYWMLNVIN